MSHWRCCSENWVPKLQRTEWGKLEAQRGTLKTWGWVRSHHKLAVREDTRRVLNSYSMARANLCPLFQQWDASIHGESRVWSLTTSIFFFVGQLSRTCCCHCKQIGVPWQYLPFIGYRKWVSTSWEVGELPSAASTRLHVSQVRISTTACQAGAGGRPLPWTLCSAQQTLPQELDWTEGAKQSMTLQPLVSCADIGVSHGIVAG